MRVSRRPERTPWEHLSSRIGALPVAGIHRYAISADGGVVANAAAHRRARVAGRDRAKGPWVDRRATDPPLARHLALVPHRGPPVTTPPFP